MAKSKKEFEGKTSASVMAKILEAEPPSMASLQPMTPPALDRVVKKCLAKEPEERWQNAKDLTDELKWIAEGGSQAGSSAPLVAQRTSRERLAWSVAAAMFVAVLALAAFEYLHRAQPDAGTMRLFVSPPATWTFGGR